jgi:hypothetical protein
VNWACSRNVTWLFAHSTHSTHPFGSSFSPHKNTPHNAPFGSCAWLSINAPCPHLCAKPSSMHMQSIPP